MSLLPLARLPALLAGALLLFATPAPASGQALMILLFGDRLSSERFQLGINADLGWTSQSDIAGTSSRRSFSFGAYGEILLSDRWRLQPELMLKTPGGVSGLGPGDPGVTFDPTGDPALEEALTTGSIERRTQSIAIPVLLKHVRGRWGLGFGGQAAFLLSATDRLEATVEQGALQLDADIESQLNRVDLGLVFSLDFALQPDAGMRSPRVNARYYLGLRDAFRDGAQPGVRNSGLFIGIDVPVGGRGDASDEPNASGGDR